MRVLTVSYGGSHAATLAPVVRALRSMGAEVTALGLTTARAVFDRNGTSCLAYADVLTASELAEATRHGSALLADVNGIAVGIPDRESIAYLGACYADLVAEYGEEGAHARYAADGRHAFLPERTMGRVIDRVRPDVVVVTNSPKSERAAIRAANRRGISTLLVPDLTADPAWEHPRALPFEAKWYAAMSPLARENLIRLHGIEPGRIVVTGQPAMDKSGVPDVATSRGYVESLVGQVHDYVLALSSPTPPGIARRTPPGDLRAVGPSWAAFIGLRWLLASLPAEAEVLVKPHPSDGAVFGTLPPDPRLRVLPHDSDVNRALRGARFVVALAATTAVVDALSMDIPAAELDPADVPSTPILQAMGIPVAMTAAEAARLVPACWTGAAFAGQAAVRAQMVVANANAAQNVADFVCRIAETTPNRTA